MRIASRFDDRYKSEKCPRCSMISQNFLIIDDSGALFGCLKCGTVFIPSFIRDLIDVKALLAHEKDCTCEYCKRICESKAGRVSHERHCDKNPGKGEKGGEE